MGRDLTIPKRGDLVVCVQSGFIANTTSVTLATMREGWKPRELQEGTMGIVTCTRKGGSTGIGTLSVTWFDGVKTKHYLNGNWARNVGGWKQWLRVVEHKQ
jgi:hypothetical protein